MFRNVALSACLMGGCIWFLGMTTRANSAAPDAPNAAFKPVATVHSLMHGQGMFFKTIRTKLNEPADPTKPMQRHRLSTDMGVCQRLSCTHFVTRCGSPSQFPAKSLLRCSRHSRHRACPRRRLFRVRHRRVPVGRRWP